MNNSGLIIINKNLEKEEKNNFNSVNNSIASGVQQRRKKKKQESKEKKVVWKVFVLREQDFKFPVAFLTKSVIIYVEQ